MPTAPIINVEYKKGTWCSCHGKHVRTVKLASFGIGMTDTAQRHNYTVGFDLCAEGVAILRRKTSGFASRKVSS